MDEKEKDTEDTRTSLTNSEAAKVTLISQVEKVEGAMKEENEKLMEKKVKAIEDNLATLRRFKDYIDSSVQATFTAFQTSVNLVDILCQDIQIPQGSMEP